MRKDPSDRCCFARLRLRFVPRLFRDARTLTSIPGRDRYRFRLRKGANIRSPKAANANRALAAGGFDLIPADELDVRGRLVVPRVTRDGAGAALVAVRKPQAPEIPQRFVPPRVYTRGYGSSSLSRAQMRDRIPRSTCDRDGQHFRSHFTSRADFTAPLASGPRARASREVRCPGDAQPGEVCG